MSSEINTSIGVLINRYGQYCLLFLLLMLLFLTYLYYYNAYFLFLVLLSVRRKRFEQPEFLFIQDAYFRTIG